MSKRCPRCNGNFFYTPEYTGPYLQCLQCGFIHYLPRPVTAIHDGKDAGRSDTAVGKEKVSTR